MNTLIHKTKRISPMLAVANMKETIRFYTDVLRFSIQMESEKYGMREFHVSDPNGCLVFVGQKIMKA